MPDQVPRDRTVRAVLSHTLKPITSATDPDSFKTAFRSIFLARSALSSIGLSHGDISPAHLHVYYSRSDDAEQTRSPRGVLTDWDITGSPMDAHRTFSLSFAARDLLEQVKPSR